MLQHLFLVNRQPVNAKIFFVLAVQPFAVPSKARTQRAAKSSRVADDDSGTSEAILPFSPISRGGSSISARPEVIMRATVRSSCSVV